jgi:hypothetical protein
MYLPLYPAVLSEQQQLRTTTSTKKHDDIEGEKSECYVGVGGIGPVKRSRHVCDWLGVRLCYLRRGDTVRRAPFAMSISDRTVRMSMRSLKRAAAVRVVEETRQERSNRRKGDMRDEQ